MSKINKNLTTEAAVLLWLEHLKEEGLAAHSIEAYERDIKHLIRLYPLDSPVKYEHNHLEFALGQLHAERIQPRSLARMLSAWRNFFNWHSEQYQSGYNPTLGVQAPYGHYPDPEILFKPSCC